MYSFEANRASQSASHSHACLNISQFQLPVADPFLEKYNLSDSGKFPSKLLRRKSNLDQPANHLNRLISVSVTVMLMTPSFVNTNNSQSNFSTRRSILFVMRAFGSKLCAGAPHTERSIVNVMNV